MSHDLFVSAYMTESQIGISLLKQSNVTCLFKVLWELVFLHGLWLPLVLWAFCHITATVCYCNKCCLKLYYMLYFWHLSRQEEAGGGYISTFTNILPKRFILSAYVWEWGSEVKAQDFFCTCLTKWNLTRSFC